MIAADASMYRSKRSGKNRVTGVPVMDVEAAGRPADDLAGGEAPIAAAATPAPPVPVPARAKTSGKRAKGATGDSV
jgi:hypothetical protein